MSGGDCDHPPHPLLEGVYLKIGRAAHHLQALDEVVTEYLDAHVETSEPAAGSKPGHYVFKARVTQPPPMELSLFVGDFAHNARSALDHLVTAMLERNGKPIARRSAFPIYRDQKHYEIRGRFALEGLTHPQKQLVERLQPYRNTRGGMRLARLSDLNNVDKHRTLHPVVLRTGATQPGIELSGLLDQRPAVVSYRSGRELSDGAEVFDVQLPTDPEPDVRMKGHIPVDLGVRHGSIIYTGPEINDLLATPAKSRASSRASSSPDHRR